jgi:protease I
VENELRSYLKDKKDFFRGPGFPVPLQRDSESNLKLGFTVLDGNYLSARWPGDIHKFCDDFQSLIVQSTQNMLHDTV